MNLFVPIAMAVLGGGTGGDTPAMCFAAPNESSAFYRVALVTTKRVPGSGMASGVGQVTFSPSPFGVNLTQNGDYLRDVYITVTGLKPAARGSYVAWVTTPSLDRTTRLGVVGQDGIVRGQVEYNKFLLVISLEDDDGSSSQRWKGPIALRGMSRSGAMHTSAGHGPFVVENCTGFGFNG
jgi:hypothetical protein